MTSQVESAQCMAEISSTKVEKIPLKDFSPTEQLALAWVKRRVILNSITTNGWFRNITEVQKKAVMGYISEIVSQANLKFTCDIETTPKVVKWVIKALLHDRKELARTSEKFVGCQYLQISGPPEDCQTYMQNRRREVLDPKAPFSYYLHGREIMDMLVFILLFMNPGVEEAHIHHWYHSKNTPLQDEDMQNQMMTTPTQMLAQSAAAMTLAIWRIVSRKTKIHFGTELHADYQDTVHQAILLALASPIHGPALAVHLLALHGRGMNALRGTIGLDVAVEEVYNPITVEDLEVVQEALQLAQATGLHLQASTVEYSLARDYYTTPIHIPETLEELVLPLADVAQPSESTIHSLTSQSLAATGAQSTTASPPPTTIDPRLFSLHAPALRQDFADDFLAFSQGYPDM
ncbi:uncharacterized protein HD556DRAFT_1307057 [Suillus plorans]|uniref:Uncharacterized protein n=1 Tax=Suillus plorans TaxID=116603 RepID=A0A9P7ATD7_9AGAM|nr:uncharacterized protein HD556DRAFT_1307057 [Suillus plorans]KAG1796315.1 hypothetical protein HD556DRAFT_1307057 [Suillus plorans]